MGVGATKAISVAARIVAAPYARTKEESPITVVLQPSGLGGQTTHVRLYVEPLGGGARTLLGDKLSPPLAESAQSVEFIYKPEQPGRVHLVAEVDRVPGEPRPGSGKEPGRRRNHRPRRLLEADVRGVRTDLGMAVHQGGLPSRSLGGHEGLPHVPVLVGSPGAAEE